MDLCFQSVEVLSSLTFFFLVPLSTTSTTVAVSLTRISTCTTSRVAKALVAKVLCSTLFFFFFEGGCGAVHWGATSHVGEI